MTEVEGMEYCVTHGGVLVEGDDDCAYGFIESDSDCDGAPMFYEAA